MSFESTKIIELGSCAFRQPQADSHCRFLHGYRLTAKFWFTSKELDQNNWVVDFGSLKELKKLLQDQFDHTTCIARTDPKLELFESLRDAGVCDLRIMDGVGIEKFAEWCHAAADNFVSMITEMRCRCVAVEVFEHESNSAIYKKKPSSVLGAEYLQAHGDEIVEQWDKSTVVDAPEAILKKTNKTSIKNDVDVKHKQVTKPPFAGKKKNGLWPEKQTNKWTSEHSTWGF